MAAMATAADRGARDSQVKRAYTEKRQKKHMPLELVKVSLWFSVDVLVLCEHPSIFQYISMIYIPADQGYSIQQLSCLTHPADSSTNATSPADPLKNTQSAPRNVRRFEPAPKRICFWVGNTIDSLLLSAAKLRSMVDSLVQTGTFSSTEAGSYEEPARLWETLWDPIMSLWAEDGIDEEVLQDIVKATNSGQTAGIMEAYKNHTSCDPDPERDVKLQELSEEYEAAISGSGNPSRLSKDQLQRLKKAIQAACYVSEKAYGDVTNWIIRNDNTAAMGDTAPKATSADELMFVLPLRGGLPGF